MKRIAISCVCILLILTSFSMGCIEDEEEKGEPLKEFQISFQETRSETMNITGYTNGSEVTEIFKNFTQFNITKIRLYLKWMDDCKFYADCFGNVNYTDDALDKFNLTVIDPNQDIIGDESIYEIIFINITVNDIPQDQTINATSEKQVVDKFINDNGIGNWQINISCIDARGGQMIGDGGNDWILSIVIFYYEGIILEF